MREYLPCQVYWYWQEHNNRSLQKLDWIKCWATPHLWQKLDVIKEIPGTQTFCSKKKAKTNQKKKQRFPSGLKISYKLELHYETSIMKTYIYIFISLYMQKTSKSFEKRKQISSKLFYVLLNWEKNWNGIRMLWMKP